MPSLIASLVSRFTSTNRFAALRHQQLHNRVSLPENPILFPEYLVRKNKNYKVTGSMSEGPGPNTITRAGIVAARMAAQAEQASTPPNKNKGRRTSPLPRPSPKPAGLRNPDMEAKARALQAQIDRQFQIKHNAAFEIAELREEKNRCIVESRGNSWARPSCARNTFTAASGTRIPMDMMEGGNFSEYVLRDAEVIADWRKRSSGSDSFASRANSGVSVPGRLFSPKKATNPAHRMTDDDYRVRHNKWVAEERQRGGGYRPDGLASGQRRPKKKGTKGKALATDEPRVFLGVPENAERQVSQESVDLQFVEDNKDIVFEINSKQYQLVDKDQKSRPKKKSPPVMSHMRKYAKAVFTTKRQVNKSAMLVDENSHDSMDSADYEKYLKGSSSQELGGNEIIEVQVCGKKGEPMSLYHDLEFPVWANKGFCYLAAFKVRAMENFEWPKNPFLKDIVNITRNFRKDGTFHVWEVSKNQLHLSLTAPSQKVKEKALYYEFGGWAFLENLVDDFPKARIGGEKKIDEVPKFDGSNWPEFSFRMKAYLESKGLWEVMDKTTVPVKFNTVEGQEDVPDPDDPKGKKTMKVDVMSTTPSNEWRTWNLENCKAKGIIALKLHSSMRGLVKETAHETWAELVKKYDTPGFGGVFLEFKNLLAFKFSGARNPATEINEMMIIVEKLAENNFPIPDPMLVMFILNALPSTYNVLASTVNLNMHVKNVQPTDMIPMFSGEWECMKATQGGTHTSAAFVAKSNIKQKPQGQQPQWQGDRLGSSNKKPNNKPQQNLPQQWQKVQHGKKPHQAKPYSWGHQNQLSPQQQLELRKKKNKDNRNNKKLAKALRQQEQAGPFQQPNMPRMANMALLSFVAEREQQRIRLQESSDLESLQIKTEMMDLNPDISSMDIDFVDENDIVTSLPPMELDKVPGAIRSAKRLKLGHHSIDDSEWHQAFGWTNDEEEIMGESQSTYFDHEIMTENDFNHMDHMRPVWDGEIDNGPIDNDVDRPWRLDGAFSSPKRKRSERSSAPLPMSTPSPLR